MKPNKLAALVVCAAMIITLAGCGGSAAQTNETAAATQAVTEPTEESGEDYSDEDSADEDSDDEDYSDEDSDEDYSDEDSDDEDYSEDDSTDDEAESDSDYLYGDYTEGEWWGADDEYEDDYDTIHNDDTGIDWDTVEHIDNDADALRYFNECTDQRMTSIPVYYVNGYSLTNEQFMNMTNQPWVANNVYYDDEDNGEICLTYDTIYYPGTRVADAYKSGDTSELSADEKSLYDIAVEIVNAANEQPTQLRKELYIHDKICEAVKYYNDKVEAQMPRHCTAIGVFLDGQANCQGYSDAFYMLGTMAGLEVGKQSGQANGGGHVWNTIKLGGNYYFVDVTWDDDQFTFNNVDYVSYLYFNIGSDLMANTHSWEARDTLNATTTTDGMFFYYTTEADDRWFGQHCDDYNSMISYVYSKLIVGDPIIYVMGTGFTTDAQTASDSIGAMLVSGGYNAQYKVNVQTMGGNTFLYVDASA